MIPSGGASNVKLPTLQKPRVEATGKTCKPVLNKILTTAATTLAPISNQEQQQRLKQVQSQTTKVQSLPKKPTEKCVKMIKKIANVDPVEVHHTSDESITLEMKATPVTSVMRAKDAKKISGKKMISIERKCVNNASGSVESKSSTKPLLLNSTPSSSVERRQEEPKLQCSNATTILAGRKEDVPKGKEKQRQNSFRETTEKKELPVSEVEIPRHMMGNDNHIVHATSTMPRYARKDKEPRKQVALPYKFNRNARFRGEIFGKS
jgi:hypothetical protein